MVRTCGKQREDHRETWEDLGLGKRKLCLGDERGADEARGREGPGRQVRSGAARAIRQPGGRVDLNSSVSDRFGFTRHVTSRGELPSDDCHVVFNLWTNSDIYHWLSLRLAARAEGAARICASLTLAQRPATECSAVSRPVPGGWTRRGTPR